MLIVGCEQSFVWETCIDSSIFDMMTSFDTKFIYADS